MVSDLGRFPLVRRERPASAPHSRILALGTCQIDALLPSPSETRLELEHRLFETSLNQPMPDLDLTGYDGVVVSLTLRHIFVEASARMDGGASWFNCLILPRLIAEGREQDYFDICASLVREHVGRIGGWSAGVPTFLLSFLHPKHNYLGNLLPRYQLSNPRYFVESLNKVLADALEPFADLHLLDLNELVELIGSARLRDDYVSNVGHASFLSSAYGPEDRIQPSTIPIDMWDASGPLDDLRDVFAQRIVDDLAILRSPLQIKAIIVDLDDTLWRGIAAEQDETPQHFTEGWPLGIAEALLTYKARGGLLAICSKNDEGVIRPRFDAIFHGRLRLSDFASIRISYERKSENIAGILADLNVLPANVLFVDDNPREIAEVQARFPEMRFLSDEHYDWRRQILMMPETQVATITADAARRTQSIQAKVSRAAQSATMSRDEWLRSLELVVQIVMIGDDRHPRFERAFELLNKTNQFNTTGRRWDRAELGAVLRSGGSLVCALLKDRMVDHGLVCVAVVEGAALVQVVLSCRVFGNDVELAAGHHSIRLALQAGKEVRGTIVDTGRNKTSHDYFERLGFGDAGDGTFVGSVAPTLPQHLTIIAPDEEHPATGEAPVVAPPSPAPPSTAAATAGVGDEHRRAEAMAAPVEGRRIALFDRIRAAIVGSPRR